MQLKTHLLDTSLNKNVMFSFRGKELGDNDLKMNIEYDVSNSFNRDQTNSQSQGNKRKVRDFKDF